MNNITNNIYYVGVNDHDIDLFEGQYDVPLGMAYNSYVIVDDKIAIMDTVEVRFKDEWLNNIDKVLNNKKPTYLIVQHVEPDHSGNIISLIKKYPDIIVVGNNKTFSFINNFYKLDIKNKLEVKENDVLSLGKTELKFIFAPMVHWPEVMFTLDMTDKVLFSADAFGKFGALDKVDPEGWACEARRYYFGIVGKFGLQVQNVLKKLAGVDIKYICPLHGPVLDKDLSYYLNLYNIWSSYQNETDGVAVFYTSIYGNTKKAAEYLYSLLEKEDYEKVTLVDIAREDIYESVEDAFRYSRVVFATTTYNGGIFPKMNEFINKLIDRNFQNKKVGIIENGTWAPGVIRTLKAKFENSKNIELVEPFVTINSSLTEENKKQLINLVSSLK